MQPAESESGISVFISYAHADKTLRKKLEAHLSSLKNSGKIAVWQDQEILPGGNWDEQIKTRLREAKMILLLVSPDFLASKYCWEEEVKVALERHKAGTARVIPIILKPVRWQDTPLGQLQALPTEAKPVAQWASLDSALENVVQGIQKVIEKFPPTPSTDVASNYTAEQFVQDREAYIAHIERRYRYLKLAGVVPRDRGTENTDPELDTIYVPLSVVLEREEEAFDNPRVVPDPGVYP